MTLHTATKVLVKGVSPRVASAFRGTNKALQLAQVAAFLMAFTMSSTRPALAAVTVNARVNDTGRSTRIFVAGTSD